MSCADSHAPVGFRRSSSFAYLEHPIDLDVEWGVAEKEWVTLAGGLIALYMKLLHYVLPC